MAADPRSPSAAPAPSDLCECGATFSAHTGPGYQTDSCIGFLPVSAAVSPAEPPEFEKRDGVWFATHKACGWKIATRDEDFALELASEHRCDPSVSPAEPPASLNEAVAEEAWISAVARKATKHLAADPSVSPDDTIRRHYTKVCTCEWNDEGPAGGSRETTNAECVIHGSAPDPLDGASGCGGAGNTSNDSRMLFVTSATGCSTTSVGAARSGSATTTRLTRIASIPSGACALVPFLLTRRARMASTSEPIIRQPNVCPNCNGQWFDRHFCPAMP